MIDSIGVELDVYDPGFKPSLIRTPASVTPYLHWLSQPCTTRLILVWRLFLRANQEHKQECKEHNLKLRIWMKFIKLIWSSSIDLKGLVDIGEQEQEQGVWFTTFELCITSAMYNVCFTRKNRMQQPPNPNECDANYNRGPLMGSKMIHGPIDQKTVSQHFDNFWMLTCFDNFHWLQMNFDVKPKPLVSLWNYFSMHMWILENRVCTCLGHRLYLGLRLESKMDSNLSRTGPSPWCRW
jgi:hypothetical protein